MGLRCSRYKKINITCLPAVEKHILKKIIRMKEIMKSVFTLIIIALLILKASACGTDTGPLPDPSSDNVVSSVKLNRTKLKLPVGGEPVTLSASVKPENAVNKDVTWASSDNSVATVSGGVIAPVAEGTAFITVTTVEKNFTDICEVKVMDSATWDPLSVTDLPAALKVKNVNNQTSLINAVTTAEPGDHIVLADGSYNSFSITRSGTKDNPIVIKADNLLGAKINSGSVSINANWVIVYGLDFVISTIKIGENSPADDVSVWRCRFRDNTGGTNETGMQSAIRTYNAKRIDIAYIEVTNWKGGLLFGTKDGSYDITVRYSLFRKTPKGYLENGSEAIRTLSGQPELFLKEINLLVHRNRFTEWNSDSETISVKSSKVIVRQNTQENCFGTINNRNGSGNLFDANWSKNSMGIGMHDGDATVCKPNIMIGNKVENATRGLTVKGGNAEPCTNTHPGWSKAYDLWVSSNTTINCNLIVGFNYTDHKGNIVKRTVIYNHTGSIEMRDEQETIDNRNQPDPTYTPGKLIWLEDNDVGPNA